MPKNTQLDKSHDKQSKYFLKLLGRDLYIKETESQKTSTRYPIEDKVINEISMAKPTDSL